MPRCSIYQRGNQKERANLTIGEGPAHRGLRVAEQNEGLTGLAGGEADKTDIQKGKNEDCIRGRAGRLDKR